MPRNHLNHVQRATGRMLSLWPYPRPNLNREFDAGYRLGLSVGAREASRDPHEPFCTEHVGELTDEQNWCTQPLLREHKSDSGLVRLQVTVEHATDQEVAVVNLYAENEDLTPAKAREVAHVLLRAADIAQGVTVGPALPTKEETVELIRQGDEVMKASPNDEGREAARRLDCLVVAAMARRSSRAALA